MEKYRNPRATEGESIFINCFLNVITCLSVNVRKFTSWISGKLCLNHCGLNCFIEYLHRKWLTVNITSYDIESAKKLYLMNLHIKTIHFLFISMYLILFKNDWTFWYKSVISSVEVYDKQIKTCHFSYLTLYQSSFIYHSWAYRLSGWYHDLGLIKGMIWKMPCSNLYLSYTCCW